MTMHEKTIILMSMPFWKLDSATALRWNMAGNRKATGVQKIAPFKDSRLLIFSPIESVSMTVKATRIVRVRFLLHCLFFDFSQPE